MLTPLESSPGALNWDKQLVSVLASGSRVCSKDLGQSCICVPLWEGTTSSFLPPEQRAGSPHAGWHLKATAQADTCGS